jgi:iron complex outermembrane receptor protein
MRILAFAFVPLAIGAAQAQEERATREAEAYYGQPIEDLMRVETQLKAEVGSRAGSRDALEAEVPIDVITAAQLRATGTTELVKALAKLIPGFNAPRPSIADGTDHAPPFTLRGLNPDQVLVLVNGKRRHQGSLLHINGTIGRGSSGVDLNTIPLRAVERVEVLRDGAAAQYGSDAIAGIINVILRGYGQESEVNLSQGRTSKGDGLVRQADAFLTRPLAEDGFINLSLEWRDRGPTNRAGADPEDQGRINTHFGDADTQDGLLAVNAEVPRGDTLWYLHGTLDRRDSSAGAFFRRAADERNLTALYPEGFLPRIEPRIFDASATAGARGILAGGLRWDLSYTHGYNDYHFYVDHSLNRSLGLSTPTSFDSGATRYSQQIVNLDLNQRLDRHVLAGGLEFRRERYRIFRGDEASYVLGPEAAWYPGAQGFGGFMPENETDASRHNLAGYLDLKYALNERVHVDAAARAERYSDFGATLDGKLALRLRATEDLLLRASGSSGFRAPSLSQSHFTSTAMIRDGENILRFGNFGVNDPVARALGATDLKPEKSRHFTLGLVYQPTSNLSASADWFITDIDDRIMPTGYIAAWRMPALSQAARDILVANGIDGAVYFSNAVGTRTRGIDLRLDWRQRLAGGSRLKVAAAYQRAVTAITRVNAAPGILGVDMTDLILDPYTRVTLEAGQPRDSVKLWAQWQLRDDDLTLGISRYGVFSSTKGDERVDFAARWTLDAEYLHRFDQSVSLAIGGENLFGAMPQEWGATDDSLMGSGKIIRYSQYAPFGYNGRFVYVRLGVKF